MVRHEVWAAAGLTTGMICIGCLERRLGHRLVAADFTAAPVNDPSVWDTARLRARKAALS